MWAFRRPSRLLDSGLRASDRGCSHVPQSATGVGFFLESPRISPALQRTQKNENAFDCEYDPPGTKDPGIREQVKRKLTLVANGSQTADLRIRPQQEVLKPGIATPQRVSFDGSR